jgi:RND family efflux transporter MFP subunit
MRRRMLWLLVLVAAAGCEDGLGRADAPPAAPVTAPPVRVVATGRIEGREEADVASKLPGRVLRFDLEEGDRVEEGAPVVVLEHGDLEARVRLAEARARKAALELARLRALRTDGVVAASELDHAEAAARARTAELDEARALLGYATVRAPFAGTLLRKFKEVGEGVAVDGLADPLFRLADLSRMKVVAEVPEGDIAGVRAGQAATVTADAYADERFAATVARVGMAVGRKRLRSDDPRTRIDEKVIEVELALAADPRLRSGMTVTVVFDP